MLEAGKSGQSCRMCLKNNSNLWFKIDTIGSVVFFFSLIMCWLAPFETQCQVQCKGVGGVCFFQQQQDKKLISVRSAFLNYSIQIDSPQT